MTTSTTPILRSPKAPHQLLHDLRNYLQHFDQTGHLGESATIAAIKSLLRTRIVEVEAELARMDKRP